MHANTKLVRSLSALVVGLALAGPGGGDGFRGRHPLRRRRRRDRAQRRHRRRSRRHRRVEHASLLQRRRQHRPLRARRSQRRHRAGRGARLAGQQSRHRQRLPPGQRSRCRSPPAVGSATTLLEISGSTGAPTGVSDSAVDVDHAAERYRDLLGLESHRPAQRVRGFRHRSAVRCGDRARRHGTVQPTPGARAGPTWGVAEQVGGGDLWIAYVEDFNTIARRRVPDGLRRVIGRFSSLSDMCSFTVSPPLNRHSASSIIAGTSQFRSGDEALGFAAATWTNAVTDRDADGVLRQSGQLPRGRQRRLRANGRQRRCSAMPATPAPASDALDDDGDWAAATRTSPGGSQTRSAQLRLGRLRRRLRPCARLRCQ